MSNPVLDESPEYLAIADIREVMDSDFPLREKGIWLKAIDMLIDLDYYIDNRSVFQANKRKD